MKDENLQLDVPDEIDNNLVKALKTHIDNRLIGGGAVKEVSAETAREAFVALLEWAEQNPTFVNANSRLDYFMHYKDKEPDRLMWWDQELFKCAEMILKGYYVWYSIGLKHELFKIKLSEMTGYQFKRYLELINLIK